jgi:hypothetical protein
VSRTIDRAFDRSIVLKTTTTTTTRRGRARAQRVRLRCHEIDVARSPRASAACAATVARAPSSVRREVCAPRELFQNERAATLAAARAPTERFLGRSEAFRFSFQRQRRRRRSPHRQRAPWDPGNASSSGSEGASLAPLERRRRPRSDDPRSPLPLRPPSRAP